MMTYCAMLDQCSVVVSADSLPIHICSALRIPLVALFGPTGPRQTGPWMARAVVLTAKCASPHSPGYEVRMIDWPPRPACTSSKSMKFSTPC
ncbi:MAG: glycosyltransferase family 9 protein [Verrucomicrobia bacterium]|nr:glycosyltransferase family 9 protein [Verrucomicrobiota bacterium]